MDGEKIQDWFNGYARSFDLFEPMIRMKFAHSFDVMRVGRVLTGLLDWGENAAAVGVAACLLHDTGRFSQYRDFGTYHDGASVDHGERGFTVLCQELPESLTDAPARKAVLEAVRWHNKKNLPELDTEAMPFCRLVRDCDKLDVFALVRRRMDEGTITALLPRHNVDGPLTEALIEEVETHWSGSYKNASSLLDFLLIQLTWTLDINYAPALRMLEATGVLSRIRDAFPRKDRRVQRVLEGLFQRMGAHTTR